MGAIGVRNTDPALWALAWLLGTERFCRVDGGEVDTSRLGEAIGLAQIFGGGIGFTTSRAADSSIDPSPPPFALLGRAFADNDAAFVNAALAVVDAFASDTGSSNAANAIDSLLDTRTIALADARGLPRLAINNDTAQGARRLVVELGGDDKDADVQSAVALVADLGYRVVAARSALADGRRWTRSLPSESQLIAALPVAIAQGLRHWASDDGRRGPTAFLGFCRALLFADEPGGMLADSSAPVPDVVVVSALWRGARSEAGDGAFARGSYADGLLSASRLLDDRDLLQAATTLRHHGTAWARWAKTLLPTSQQFSPLRDADAALSAALSDGSDGDVLFLARAAYDDALAELSRDDGLGRAGWVAHLASVGEGLLSQLRAERALCDRLSSWSKTHGLVGSSTRANQ